MIYASIKIKMTSLHLLVELKEAYQPHGKFMIMYILILKMYL